ncbi:hypothetical protein SAMN04487857_11417 [Pseudomonas sp. ok272]|uniref:hypothetical protein n=1 Tax=unclassified Pseudomonas TaxID=196821 RepID=UPI0008B011DC|nr:MULTISPECIES: hypothetical protein [unclassified Pseudomonas]SEN34210.1 hypothetical protein SAMN04487857_11417 [Pseudomonas sp. ok272]SFM84532.1 hypothetical protein SAMN04487858_107216 [Pseudomonas sp. ok602]
MTSIDTWSPWIAIIVAGSPFVLGTAGLALSLYLSRCHLDAMKEALKHSRYVHRWGPSLGKRGVLWSLLEIAKIAGMMVWPKASIRIGDASPVDLENFPPYLKRLLIINATMIFTSLAWMTAVAILLEFR